MASFEAFVPDVAAPAGSEIERFVAILVSARVNVRSTWSDDVEVSEAVFEKLAQQAAPVPSVTQRAPIKFKMLAPESRAAKSRKCGSCFATPGRRVCSICGGSGRIMVGDDSERCSACQGGYSDCMACDGTGKSRAVKVIFGEDSVRPAAHIFVPNVPTALKELLFDFFRKRGSVPDALTVDLSRDFAGADAYRGRRGHDEIRGHRADSCVAQARVYVERLDKLPSVMACEYVAFAWPFAVVVAGSYPVVHIIDNLGRPTTFPQSG
jgi:hypothetical protein